MAKWIEDPQGRLEVEKVTKELKLPVWKANYKGKFREFWNECWDKIEDYVVKLKGDTEKKSKGLNDRLVSAVGKHDGDFPIENAVVGNVYYSELTKKYYKCKIGGPAPMPNGNFIDLSILENLNRLENLFSFSNQNDINIIKFSNVAIAFGNFKNIEFNKSTDITIPVDLKNASISVTPHHTGTPGNLTAMAYVNGNKITIRINNHNTGLTTVSGTFIAIGTM
ncbi:hypothetical protein [Fusobacterium nucleatum]|uniref:hypothetical protein n=1 Tax=Fusobacterium nucleatum TaxID=851 RepID=UPI00201AB842|nr:hypothetical protein [Fusobacterium nucleatum]MCL4592547.1 hypothetical protein [Fusobacterium nucleatum YWH7053]